MDKYQIVLEARTWIGTPFHHQGRLKGIGSDCIGIVLGVGKSLGLIDYEVSNYGRIPDGNKMRKVMEEELIPIAISNMQYGDIILFKFEKEPQHVGFFTDIGVLHSYATVKKCVETSLDDTWKSRIVAVYRFKGVSNG